MSVAVAPRRFSDRPSWWSPRLSRSPSAHELRLVARAQAQATAWEGLTDAALTAEACALRERSETNGVPLATETLVLGCALVREAVRRTTGRCIYPVQILAGLVLASGSVAEMQTGEGKTLTSAIPGFLNALRWPGVHVATPNAYLAERDRAELRPAYEMLGLRVGLLPEKQDPALSRAAYRSDITYGTGYEFGFDFLRDQLAQRQRPVLRLGQQHLLSLRGATREVFDGLQTGRSCALIDEIDSVLIDEALTPLVLSINTANDALDAALYQRALHVTDDLQRGEHYVVDGPARTARLTEEGVQRSFQYLDHPTGLSSSRADSSVAQGSLAARLKRPWTQYIEQALHAKHFLQHDIDYVVRDGKVEIVDQKTGRIFSERSWRAGLHQAVETREAIPVSSEKESAARITRQRYFQLYQSLSGMTGTASGAEPEFQSFYQLGIVVIPLNTPTRRQLLPDRFFQSIDAKFSAIVRETHDFHRRGQPVLIGTRTIADSEQLSERLRTVGIAHLVLNGKQDRSESDIVAEAGRFGHVTIATNMAGRGTDIKLDQRAWAAGGLHVIGAERYESRRIDRQLAGRAARAGAPGSARFFLSAEDDLISCHAPKVARRLTATTRSDGECLTDFSETVVRLQRDQEQAGYLSRRDMLQRDRWLDNVVETLSRDTSK